MKPLPVRDATADLDVRCALCQRPRADTGIKAFALSDQDLGHVEQHLQIQDQCSVCGCRTVLLLRKNAS